MAGFAGPRANDSSLVFGYDTGYGVSNVGFSTRYYPGEPTTNYAPTDLANWGTESTAERIATGNTFRGQPTYNCRTVVGASYQGIDTTIAGLRTAAGSGGTVTMSCFVRNNNPNNYSFYAYIGRDFTSTRVILANSDWQQIQWTVNQADMNNDYVEFRPYTNNANIYLEMTMPQVEVNKGHATQFTDGTRSSTGAILDLVSTTSINASSVSFNSTGLPTFDGTDDVIQLSTALVDSLSTAELTVEAIVYHTAWGVVSSSRPYVANWNTWDNTTPNQRGFILRTYGVSSYPSFWYCWGANYTNITSSTSMSLNQFHHVVGVYKKDSYAKIYLDGVETGTTTSGTSNHLVYDDTTGTRIGYGTINTGRFVGDLPVIKLYNRALTGNEILKNYNQFKNRFNLL